jgi:hypothetical protein
MPAYDPQARLVGVLQQAGLTYVSRRDIAQGESLLLFQQFGCAAPTAVIYLPWISRMSPPARAMLERAPAPPLYVNDGEVVSGAGTVQVMSRWAWRRLLVFLQLKPDEPWTSIMLAVLTPQGCTPAAVDWKRLRRG